jgi:hypothetical protein
MIVKPQSLIQRDSYYDQDFYSIAEPLSLAHHDLDDDNDEAPLLVLHPIFRGDGDNSSDNGHDKSDVHEPSTPPLPSKVQ